MPTVLPANRSIEWSPVIAGTLVACALSVVLVQFGQALGLSFTNLRTATTVTPHSFMAFGLWALWVQLSASITGGYLAGRTLTPWDASHESELRDGAHGLLVWALSTVLTALALGAVAALGAFANAHGVEPKSDISPELMKRITIISGFALAATSLVSATVAWYMAVAGGDHRDRKVKVDKHISFRAAKSR